MTPPTDTVQSASPASPAPRVARFPYVTAVASLAVLFLFVGLTILAYRPQELAKRLGVSTTLGDQPGKADPVKRQQEVQARNRATLEGKDQTPVEQATQELIAHTERTKTATELHGQLPFPRPPAPAEKK